MTGFYDNILSQATSTPQKRSFPGAPELAIAEFALAEELGDVVEFEISQDEAEPEEEELPPGFLGPADVEALVQASLQRLKAERERRPLPRQARLRTLLKGLPLVWLHPVCAAPPSRGRPLRLPRPRRPPSRLRLRLPDSRRQRR